MWFAGRFAHLLRDARIIILSSLSEKRYDSSFIGPGNFLNNFLIDGLIFFFLALHRRWPFHADFFDIRIVTGRRSDECARERDSFIKYRN